MDNKISYPQLWQSLMPLYDEGEAKAVVRMLVEEAFGLTFTDICCGKVEALSADDRQRLEALMAPCGRASPCSMCWAGPASAVAASAWHRVCSSRAPRPRSCAAR
jgi:hypothetical protein